MVSRAILPRLLRIPSAVLRTGAFAVSASGGAAREADAAQGRTAVRPYVWVFEDGA